MPARSPAQDHAPRQIAFHGLSHRSGCCRVVFSPLLRRRSQRMEMREQNDHEHPEQAAEQAAQQPK